MICTCFSRVKKDMAWNIFYKSCFFLSFLQIRWSKIKGKEKVRITRVIKKKPLHRHCRMKNFHIFTCLKKSTQVLYWVLVIILFPKMNLLPRERSHLDLRIPTVLGRTQKNLMGKTKKVSPVTGRGFSNSSRIIHKELRGY